MFDEIILKIITKTVQKVQITFRLPVHQGKCPESFLHCFMIVYAGFWHLLLIVIPRRVLLSLTWHGTRIYQHL